MSNSGPTHGTGARPSADPASRRSSGALRRLDLPGLLGVALCAIALLVALTWLASWWIEHRAEQAAFPVASGNLELAGLSQTVQVLRDSRGIPHVEAGVELDAWLTLGFVHGQDRLGQMLWLRQVAHGRSAERIGPAGLASDRLLRTMGIRRHAEAELERLPSETRRLLEAYSEGVNSQIARLNLRRAGRPKSARSGRAELEPWTAADSLALLKLVAWTTDGGIDRHVVLDDLLRRLGSVGARPFFPSGGGVRGIAVPFEMPPPRTPDSPGTPTLIESLEKTGTGAARQAFAREWRSGFRGGSAWIISGSKTASGAPYLLADLHLSPTAPALVYEVHLRGGNLDVAGATIPGIPVIWVGHNQKVAWAATPARVSTVDLYQEELLIGSAPDESDDAEAEAPGQLMYRARQRWVPVKHRRETILVADPRGAYEVDLDIVATDHGPLVQDLVASPPDGRIREPLAASWIGALPGDGISTFVALARAESGAALVEALATHHDPALAVTYADRQGNAGVRIAGWLPQRILPTGSVPVHGRQRAFDWRSPVSPEALPGVLLAPEDEPERNALVIADNALVADPAISNVEWLWRTGKRARRIEAGLAELLADGPVDLRQAAALQADLVRADAKELVSALVALARYGGEYEPGGTPLRPEAREIVALLETWDGRLTPDSRGAAAFQITLELLTRELLVEPMGEALYERYVALPGVRPLEVVAEALRESLERRAPGGWTDYARVRQAVARSLRQAWLRLSYRLGPSRRGWSWGLLHPLQFRSFAGGPPGWGDAVAIPAIPGGGDLATVALAGSNLLRPFEVDSVASYRMAVDLAAPERMLSSLAPGQSEHPGHAHYQDGLERWLAGRPSLLVTNRLLVEEDSVDLLVLDPAP